MKGEIEGGGGREAGMLGVEQEPVFSLATSELLSITGKAEPCLYGKSSQWRRECYSHVEGSLS